MKKSLLATTALAALGAVSVAGTAAAAEKIKIGVGGYMQQWFGYASVDDGAPQSNDGDGFDQKTDAEIHFKGETTLDNGLTFGVNVQLEAETDGDQIDEQYAYVEGSFGLFQIGNENAAAYQMNSGLTSYGVTIDSGDASDWIRGLDFAASTTLGNFARDNNDSHKITYFTPRFSGFQLGVSYTPEQSQDEGAGPNENNGVLDNGFSIGANFVRSFNDVSIRASLGYEYYGDDVQAGIEEPQAFGAGLKIGFAGFHVQGNYFLEEDHAAQAGNDLETFGFGVGYSGGPFGVSLNYVHGEEDGVDRDQDTFELGALYRLGPGVEVRGSLIYVDEEEGNVDTAEGFAVVGGLQLSF
jgi:hypothetical protein